jgi:hypothetical protein
VRILVSAITCAIACGAKTTKSAEVDNHGGGEVAAGIELTVSATDGGHAAIVHNGGGATVMLHRDIVVNRVGEATPIEAAGLALRDRCDGGGPPECVALAPGATLRAMPWTDMIGDAQCDCTKCGPAPAGEYTFTITRCDDGAPVTSAPFAVVGR